MVEFIEMVPDGHAWCGVGHLTSHQTVFSKRSLREVFVLSVGELSVRG